MWHCRHVGAGSPQLRAHSMAVVCNISLGFPSCNQRQPLIAVSTCRQRSNGRASLDIGSLALLPWQGRCVLKAVSTLLGDVAYPRDLGFGSFVGSRSLGPCAGGPCVWPQASPRGAGGPAGRHGLACVTVATGRWGLHQGQREAAAAALAQPLSSSPSSSDSSALAGQE